MWQQWVSGSRNFRPELSLLLRDDEGAVAAYIQTSEYDAVLEATGKRDAFVAKVGTVPEHRRRGLASLLLRIALDRYRQRGVRPVVARRRLGEPDGCAGGLRACRVPDHDALDQLPAGVRSRVGLRPVDAYVGALAGPLAGEHLGLVGGPLLPVRCERVAVAGQAPLHPQRAPAPRPRPAP